MRVRVMTWTDQKIQMLRDMWGHGYSASEIAVRLGGMTRNAVIGKAHRLKLSVGSAASKAASNLPTQSNLGGSVIPTIKASSRKRVMLRPLPVVPTPETRSYVAPTPTVREVLTRGEGIAVTKATDRHCRWPVGDPRSPDFRFCGCTAHEGLPYCIDHARVAYQNVGKRSRASQQSAMPTVYQTHGNA